MAIVVFVGLPNGGFDCRRLSAWSASCVRFLETVCPLVGHGSRPAMGLQPEPKVLPSDDNAEAVPMLAHAPGPSRDVCAGHRFFNTAILTARASILYADSATFAPAMLRALLFKGTHRSLLRD